MPGSTADPAVWSIVAAIAAAGGAVFAGLQVWTSTKQARATTAFRHLERISDRVEQFVGFDVGAIQDEILRHYGHATGAAGLGAPARQYLALLTDLDLFAYAAQSGAASSRIEQGYMHSMYSGGIVTPAFIREYHDCCKLDTPYRHLLTRLEQAAAEPPAQAWRRLLPAFLRR